ncbi:hypothetical protein B0H13DRAFT_2303806 [Mycena leptocephala]|nr:hypothetical protein B0H13DRAFT_2303806 [Mycena leptocephala]
MPLASDYICAGSTGYAHEGRSAPQVTSSPTTQRRPLPAFHPVSLTTCKRSITTLILEHWKVLWKVSTPGLGLCEIYDSPPSLILRSPYSSSAARVDVSILSQLRTDFSALNAHRFRCRFAPSRACDACGAARETLTSCQTSHLDGLLISLVGADGEEKEKPRRGRKRKEAPAEANGKAEGEGKGEPAAKKAKPASKAAPASKSASKSASKASVKPASCATSKKPASKQAPRHNPALTLAAMNAKSDDEILDRLSSLFKNIASESRKIAKLGGEADDEGLAADEKQDGRRKTRKKCDERIKVLLKAGFTLPEEYEFFLQWHYQLTDESDTSDLIDPDTETEQSNEIPAPSTRKPWRSRAPAYRSDATQSGVEKIEAMVMKYRKEEQQNNKGKTPAHRCIFPNRIPRAAIDWEWLVQHSEDDTPSRIQAQENEAPTAAGDGAEEMAADT